MASDTATLDLERVHEERRRLEAARDEGRLQPIILGPDDRAPEDAGPVDTDPATRAHLIVQEVMAAAERRGAIDGEDAGTTLDPAADDPAAARARRIVEEVLAAAGETSDADAVHADTTVGIPADAEAPPAVRADLVLLGIPQPIVRIPGPLYLPTPEAFRPRPDGSLDRLVERALQPAASPGSAVDAEAAPQTLSSAIRGAAESSSMPGIRWIVAGTVWALAFALAVPLMVRGLFSSVDLTIDLFSPNGDPTTPVEQPVDDMVEDELTTDAAAADGS